MENNKTGNQDDSVKKDVTRSLHQEILAAQHIADGVSPTENAAIDTTDTCENSLQTEEFSRRQ